MEKQEVGYCIDDHFDYMTYHVASLTLPRSAIPEVNLWRAVIQEIIRDLRGSNAKARKTAMKWLCMPRTPVVIFEMADMNPDVLSIIQKKLIV